MRTPFLITLVSLFLAFNRPAQCAAASRRYPNAPAAATNASSNWSTPATLRHGLRRESGVLILTARQVEFRPRRGLALRWKYEDVKTFRLTDRRFTIWGYENRHWPIPGERSFNFRLATPIPASISANLANRVGKPSSNARPDTVVAAQLVIDARHEKRLGGSNGTLRFQANGIDYIAVPKDDSRSWRWADIQTIALTDPYHFRVAGYREIYDFSLKKPMDSAFFDKLWDQFYGKGLNLQAGAGGEAQ